MKDSQPYSAISARSLWTQGAGAILCFTSGRFLANLEDLLQFIRKVEVDRHFETEVRRLDSDIQKAL